jgi:hypothetical protein
MPRSIAPHRQDGVAGLQGHAAADVGEQFPHSHDHFAGPAVLADLAVQPGSDLDVGGVHERDPRTEGAEGVEPLGPCPLLLGRLDLPGGHIIAAGVAADRLQRGLGRSVPKGVPDDGDQFALEVDP